MGRRKVIPQSPLVDADLRIRAVWRRPDLPRADRLHRLLETAARRRDWSEYYTIKKHTTKGWNPRKH
jgi:hypothetical protein